MTRVQPQGRVLSVQVGPVRSLRIAGREVTTGILKREVGGRIAVEALGLAGDEQADLTVHGGLAKAVYAYPVEHYPFWVEQRRAWGQFPDLPHGSLGENLTLTGLLERELYVGDRLCLPDCELRVTQPREPCYKFNASMGSDEAVRCMARSGRCGFYLAVDVPGSIGAGDDITVKPGQRLVPVMSLFRAGRRRSA